MVCHTAEQQPSLWRGVLGRMHRALGKSSFAVRLAVKVRNQCASIIRYQLGEDWRFGENGESWLVQFFGPSCSTFFDVGANVGEWTQSLLVSSPGIKRGVLLDASDSAVSKLHQRFRNDPRVSIIHAAVSDVVGEAFFYEEEGAGMTSSLIEGFSAQGARKARVPVTTVDVEAAKHGFSFIDILKIDAEGYDLHVIRGAQELLRTQRIGIVQFEYNAPWADAGSTLSAARALLSRYGYELFLLKSTGFYRIDYIYFGEFFNYANFIAVSKQKMPMIEAMVKTHPFGKSS